MLKVALPFIYAKFSSHLQQYFHSQTSSISNWCQEGKLEPSGMLPNSFPMKSRLLTFQELEVKSLQREPGLPERIASLAS